MEYDLTEPVKAYEYFLKDAYHEAATNFFDGIATDNKVDIEANRETNRLLKQCKKKIDETTKKLNGNKAVKGLCIVATILFFITAIILIVVMVQNFQWYFILIDLACIAAGVGFIFLIINSSKKINSIKEALNKLNDKKNELLNEARGQMQNLNDAYDWNLPAKILTDTIPLIQMDQYFDKNKFYYLNKKYGFKENSEKNISTVYIQSGSILGNPFLLERNFVSEMVPHVYHGSLVISWTTTVSDGKGGSRTVHHTQTLTATVTKPAAEYYYETWLVYGNEAAPRLSFSREPSNANNMDEKAIKKYAQNFLEDMEKQIKKTPANKKPLTLMSNEEFEALFHAVNRDNDVEFRLLFTPLAQKNMLELIKSKKPYGDDFSFIKNKELNYIKTKHAQNADLDGDPAKFIHYDYDTARDYFINYCDNFFKSFYFDLAPLLCIPLYQQHMSFEEIFKGTLDPNLTSFETEVMANRFDQEEFKHEKSDTPATLKRQFVKCSGKGDIVNIHAHSYQKVAHTEFVPKLGGDGFTHNVPVVWYEYVPLEKVTPFAIQECRTTERKFRYNIQNQALRDFLSRIADKNMLIYSRGLVSLLLRKNTQEYNADELNNYLLKDN